MQALHHHETPSLLTAIETCRQAGHETAKVERGAGASPVVICVTGTELWERAFWPVKLAGALSLLLLGSPPPWTGGPRDHRAGALFAPSVRWPTLNETQGKVDRGREPRIGHGILP